MRFKLPPVTLALLLANIAVYLLQGLAAPSLVESLELWPPGTMFQPWQLVTYAFLHGGFSHIFFNMFALFMFGPPLEYYWGGRRFAVFYFVCVLTAAATQQAVAFFTQSQDPTLGASGGIFGLLLAFAWYFPRQRIMLLFPPIPLPAWAFVTLYALLEMFLGVTGTQADVAHFAHLGGMLGGAAMILFWRMQDGAFTPASRP
jgi:membrane associated rhomboid family serine protease